MTDPIALEIFKNLFASVAEEMGVTLGRTGYSPNIKERRDYSCAIFDDHGRLIAQAAHIPVHLGAMPMSVRTAIRFFTFAPGDLVILNDPYLGGTHLPDITLVSPIFVGGELVGFAASRAHHADVGGMSPGSMPLATEIYQEGVIIPPLKLVEAGRLNKPLLDLILRNVRTPDERLGDLNAQMAAHEVGARRLAELIGRYGLDEVRAQMAALLQYSERLTRHAIGQIPDGEYYFEDFLDDDGITNRPIKIAVTLKVKGEELTADFTGSDPECIGPVNAVEAVTQSAVYYVVRCLAGEEVPANAGCFRPVKVIAPEGTVVNARPPRAVSGGNVETSQRIVDVVLGAVAQAVPDRVPAASQGTMNNVVIGGWDPFRNRYFAYYETIGGGAGAGKGKPGLSATHVHMTNTQNTPVEALEFAYPLRVRRYAVRRGSGGPGQFPGGDGIIREYEILVPATVTVVTERRRFAPYGLAGGRPGKPGENLLLISRDGELETQKLPSKATVRVESGARLVVQTPGGGGWGEPPDAG